MNDYLNWHYNLTYKKLLTVFNNLFIFPVYYFSIPLHLSTLFSPWKRQIIAKKRGFRLNDVFGVISFNLTSRFIGFFIRISFIGFGLFLCIFLPLIFLPLILVWPFIPGVTYIFYSNRQKSVTEELQELFLQADSDSQIKYFLNSNLGKNILSRLGIQSSFLLKTFPANSGHNLPVSNSLEEFYEKLISHDFLITIFSALNIKIDHLINCQKWYQTSWKDSQDTLLLSSKRIRSITGIGTEWAYGYTVTLDKYAHDLTKSPSPFPFLLGRDKELKEIERGLLKSENNNCLIIGEPGVGRHILISTLAHNLFMGKCDQNLAHKRIIKLDMHALFADAPNHDKLKALFSDLLYEAVSAGNIYLYLDDLDKYLAVGEGRIDLTDVVEKFGQSRVGLIGITTPDNFHTFIEPNPALNKIFTQIRLEQPATSEVLNELEVSIVPVLETKYPVIITFFALEKVIADADRFLTSSPFPGKAVELLEETVIWKIAQKKGGFLTASDIDAYLSQKLNLPLGELEGKESEKLLNLEDFLHRHVINQHQAIRAIASSLRRSRLNISSGKKPIGSFLFLGPTGVGKTETAKALNRAYFQNSGDMVRFDMSEFQGEQGLTRLIGSPVGHTGELTSKLREKPYGVVLFDEIEKSPAIILNLFLTVLDEGYITDARGKKVDCRNTIIIATSNAGAEFIRESIIMGIKDAELSKNVIEYILKNKIFSPEFVNRFDATVVYTPLSEGQLKEVAKLMLNNLNERLKQKEISVDISPLLVNHLAGLGSNLEFGARSIRREIETNIEDQIAQKMLKGKINKNQPVIIEV